MTTVDTYLERIERLDPRIGAFWTVTADMARAHGPGPLAGVTVAVKDNIDVGGVRCTSGALFFADNVPERDAEAIRRLRSAGAAIIGKTALHELAFGGTTQNEHFGACRNPWDLERIPGGSSGGSGAAVAADLCAAALGTDTGGSVRVPASLCGVAGLRPTHGLVPLDGAFPTSWSFDTIGPLAREARMLRTLTEVMSGTLLPRGSEPAPRVGLFLPECDPEIAAAVRAASGQMGDVSELEPPQVGEAWTTVWRIVAAEALAIHRARLSESPELYGEDVRARLLAGAAIDGVQLATDIQWGREWRARLLELFGAVDVIALPTTLDVASRIDDSEMNVTTRSVSAVTYPWALVGFPALALPCGLSREGLPMSIQLVGPPGSDARLLDIGEAFQAVTEWHLGVPVIAQG